MALTPPPSPGDAGEKQPPAPAAPPAEPSTIRYNRIQPGSPSSAGSGVAGFFLAVLLWLPALGSGFSRPPSGTQVALLLLIPFPVTLIGVVLTAKKDTRTLGAGFLAACGLCLLFLGNRCMSP